MKSAQDGRERPEKSEETEPQMALGAGTGPRRGGGAGGRWFSGRAQGREGHRAGSQGQTDGSSKGGLSRQPAGKDQLGEGRQDSCGPFWG